MLTIWIFLLAVLLAGCATTYALTRLAPVEARPPRSAVAILRLMRWLAKPENARAAVSLACLGAFACFTLWTFIFYPDVAITLAVLVGAFAAVSHSRST